MAPWLKNVLDHLRLTFRELQHADASPSLRLGNRDGTRAVKTVFLTDGDRPVAVVLPADDRIDVSRVRSVLGNDDVRFATKEEIAGWFRGCDPDCVPPLPLRADLRILMDRALACFAGISFPSGTPETSVSVSFRAWYRAVRPGVGRFVMMSESYHAKKRAPVLVVEDETDTNDLLCRLLEREGIDCQGAEHGRHALDLAALAPPSAILLDLMLPDMNGFDVYERLRRTGPIRRIPTIVVTALDDAESRRRSVELGADAYLTKPFLPERLLAEVEEVLTDARG